MSQRGVGTPVANSPINDMEYTPMNKKILALALGAGALFAAPAFAQDPSGFFIDGRFGSASIDEDDFDDDASAFQINAGYRWGGWGIEGGYVDFGSYEGEDLGFNIDADIDGWMLGINGRSSFSGSWYLSGRLGAFFWDADADTVICESPANCATISAGAATQPMPRPINTQPPATCHSDPAVSNATRTTAPATARKTPSRPVARKPTVR